MQHFSPKTSGIPPLPLLVTLLLVRAPIRTHERNGHWRKTATDALGRHRVILPPFPEQSTFLPRRSPATDVMVGARPLMMTGSHFGPHLRFSAPQACDPPPAQAPVRLDPPGPLVYCSLRYFSCLKIGTPSGL